MARRRLNRRLRDANSVVLDHIVPMHHLDVSVNPAAEAAVIEDHIPVAVRGHRQVGRGS